MKSLRIVMAFLILILAACGSKQSTVAGKDNNLVRGKPAWYWAPTDGGSLGGVGESGLHINGPSAQRQLAVSRALEDLARQKGVMVSSVQEITHSATNHSEGTTQMATYSVQTVDGTRVTAYVREVWQDPDTQRIYVWVTELK